MMSTRRDHIKSILVLYLIVLLIGLGSCEKPEAQFALGISAFVIQSNSGGEPTFDLYIGFAANEEIAEGSASITKDGIPVEGTSYIPNTYEIFSNKVSSITDLNGTYILRASSKNRKTVSHVIDIDLQESYIENFSITDFVYNGNEISGIFKEIDKSADMRGYYINPVYGNDSKDSRAYALRHIEQLSNGVGQEQLMSFPYLLPMDCISAKVYPVVVKKNGVIHQLLFGEPLILSNN